MEGSNKRQLMGMKKQSRFGLELGNDVTTLGFKGFETLLLYS